MSVRGQGQNSPFLEQVQNRQPRRASGKLQGYYGWQAGCGILETSMLSRATAALLSVQHLQRCCLAWAISHNSVRSMSSAASFAASLSSSSFHYHRLPIGSCCSASSLSGPAAAAHGVDSKAMARIGGGAEQRLEHVSTTGAEIGPEGWVRPGAKSKQIFCNRSLNMKGIVAVGFDMDYTLAQYKPETFEVLAYMGTVRKLVHNLGYPVELLDWEFDWKYMVRGLVLDKKRGNILKMDRHKYVKVAHHGFKALSREDRACTYGSALCRESFDEPDYALIDTLFSLAEAYLFAQLVTLKDSCPEKLAPDYYQMYGDVRAAVDLCHRDGTLKLAVAKNPGKYINEDNKILPMVKMLRESGKLTFLVTNSLWDYTHVVMNYLFGKSGTEGGVPRSHDWLTYFDIVITGSAKPAFFKEGNHAPLFKVDVQSGMLQNTDNGSPLVEVVGRAAVQTFANLDQNVLPKQGWRVFQGGGVAHLHKLLHIEASAQVMYVGDHIYGDILRSKKALGWRTMLVVPELESELDLLQVTAGIHKEVQKLRHQRNALEDTLHQLEWELKHAGTCDEKTALQSELQPVQMQRDAVREQHRQEQRECHHKFHKIWGQLMKTGYQNSRFAHQVERFACLYTSQVTNLCNYSPDKCYRTSEDYMPHEMDVYTP